ncbi:MAG TPA: hypothetical protein VLV55_14360 [Rhizomicrobium sp.]|nr:hypothetical protein [Rhizomicrobium sp.]
MILSAKYNYIYIRPRKTASTTIQRVLIPSAGPDDVIVTSDTRSLGILQKPDTEIPDDLLHTHMAIAEIRPFIRDDFWKSAFKFASERHPYEKAVSLAYFRFGKPGLRKKRPGVPWTNFEECLARVVDQGGCDGYSLYTIDGSVILDDVIRQETLEADLRRIGGKLGIPVPDALPDAKTVYRSDNRPAREILTEGQRKAIYQARRPEFDYFGYEP